MRDVLPRESPRRGTILEAEVEAGRGDEPGPRECALYFRKNNSEAAFMTVRLPKAPGTVAALLLIALNKFDEFINKGAGLNAPPRVAVSTFAGGNIVTHARITHKHVMVSPEARVRFEGRQADVVVSALWEVGNENALAARLAEAVRRHLTALDVWTKPLRLARAPEDAVDRQLMAARLADLAALLRVALERELTRAEVVFAKKTCEVCFEGEVMHRLDGFLPVWFGPRAGGASPFLARLARRLDLDPNSEVVDLVKRQAVALTIACHRLQSAVSDDSRASSPATPPAAPPSARAAGETQLARMIGGLVDALVEGGADVVFSGDVGLRAKPVREVQGYVFCADADAWAAALSARLRDESELRLVMLHRRAIVRWGAETLGSLALMPASRFEETALRVARTDHLDCAVARINVDTDDRLLASRVAEMLRLASVAEAEPADRSLHKLRALYETLRLFYLKGKRALVVSRTRRDVIYFKDYASVFSLGGDGARPTDFFDVPYSEKMRRNDVLCDLSRPDRPDCFAHGRSWERRLASS